MKRSAGIMVYRLTKHSFEVLLIHPGGPYYKRRDNEIWSVPKGLIKPGEDELSCALREFTEETGFTAVPPFINLEPVKYKSGKLLTVWAAEGNFNTSDLISNTFALEWPPGSGIMTDVPEADKGEWFEPATALQKILPAQKPLIIQLASTLGRNLE